jgi:hypothetical protein
VFPETVAVPRGVEADRTPNAGGAVTSADPNCALFAWLVNVTVNVCRAPAATLWGVMSTSTRFVPAAEAEGTNAAAKINAVTVARASHLPRMEPLALMILPLRVRTSSSAALRAPSGDPQRNSFPSSAGPVMRRLT